MTDQIKEYKLKIPSQTNNLELIRNFVGEVAKKVGFEDKEIDKIELAVDEACTNVIQHAYKRQDGKDIDVAVKLDYQKLTIVVTDMGETFTPDQVEIPDLDKYLAELRVGGLGIYLMKSLMDEVEYESGPGGENQVRMVKYILKQD